MRLLRRIERLMEDTGIKPTQLGRQAINDPRLVQDLRNGRVLRAATESRVIAFIEGREGEAA